MAHGTSARPIFLFVHYQDPHGPYAPPAGWDEAFGALEAGASQPLPVLESDTDPGGIPRYQQIAGLDRLGQYRRRYAGEIAYFDASLWDACSRPSPLAGARS